MSRDLQKLPRLLKTNRLQLQRLLANAEDKQRPLQTNEDQQILLETGRRKWRPPKTTGERPAETNKNNWRPLKSTRDQRKLVETPNFHNKLLPNSESINHACSPKKEGYTHAGQLNYLSSVVWLALCPVNRKSSRPDPELP